VGRVRGSTYTLIMGNNVLEMEHAPLLATAQALTERLAAVAGNLRPRDVTHEQHYRFAERAWALHGYLRGALALVANDLYPPAFAVLRSALEHHAQDHLLFLGNRYRATVRDVSDETLEEWKRAIEEGREHFAAILDVRRVGRNRAEIVRSGVHFTGGEQGPDAPALSIYYSIIYDYDPFTGGKTAQEFIGEWPFREDAKHRRGARQAEVWAENLAWRQLKENLLLNDCYTSAELARWEVHYSFLSAYTHPTARGLDLMHGRNFPKAIRYDHYASELALLYVITFARLELEVFEAMTCRVPVVDLGGWDAVRADIARGEALSSHLWFPRGTPHAYDRVQEANRRGVTRQGAIVPMAERPKPGDLTDEDVLYYSNPLRRIIAMHSHLEEMTGFTYISPWPRDDAFLRRTD
jgi:hypothetical protein